MGWPGKLLFTGYRRLLTHPRYGIWVILLSLAYIISPIDLSPDLLPILGQVDDVALILVMVSAFTQWVAQRNTLANETAEAGKEPTNDASATQTIDVKAVPLEPDLP